MDTHFSIILWYEIDKLLTLKHWKIKASEDQGKFRFRQKKTKILVWVVHYIVTEKPREVAGERLLRRLSTPSYGKVASRFLIDVPIGNTKNAKALQVNKL